MIEGTLACFGLAILCLVGMVVETLLWPIIRRPLNAVRQPLSIVLSEQARSC